MGFFGELAKVVAAPVRAAGVPIRVVEKVIGLLHKPNVFDDVADAIQDTGEETDRED